MAIPFSANPYYSDYDPAKKFYKILFKPGFSVQNREVINLQFQLQNQITQFGNNLFINGTSVIGANRFFESEILAIKLDSTFNGINVALEDFVGKTIVGNSSGTEAIVKQTLDYVDALNPKTLYVKIVSGTEFQLGETLTYVDGITTGSVNVQATDAFFDSMIFSIDSGVFYINGYFVYNDAQSIVVDRYSNSSTKSIGWTVVENIVTADDDESLLDNAQGSPNFAAPGADRYFIDLVLTVKETNAPGAEGYIELTRVNNGELTLPVSRTLYAELGKELARRTYDESGSYTVRPYPISFKDHITEAKVRPVISAGAIINFTIINPGSGFTVAPIISIIGDGTGATATTTIDSNPANPTYQQITSVNVTAGGSGYSLGNTFVNVAGDVNKFSVALDPGKSYVRGFEFETTSQSLLTLNRARTTEIVDNLDVSVVYGNFMYVNTVKGVFDTTLFTTVELHNVIHGSVAGAGTKIGSAKVRFLKYLSGTIGNVACVYRMYLFDIVVDSGKAFKDVESIVTRSGASVLSGANIDLLSKVDGDVTKDAFLSGTDTPLMVFPLNHQFVKDLKDGSNVSQNDYTFQRVFASVSFSAGAATIQTNNGSERFQGGTGAYGDLIKNQYYHVVVTAPGTSGYTTGQVINFNSTRSIIGGTIVPLTAHQLTFNVGTASNFTATIIATIDANAQSEKVKNLQNYSAKIISSPNTTNNGRDTLDVSDIFDIKAVYNTGTVNPSGQVTVNPTTGVVTSWGTVPAFTDVTNNYTKDNGQRDNYYDHGNLILNGVAPGNTDYLVVVFNYFTHTGNGFLGVGSYSIPYETIPSYTSTTTGRIYNLRDSVDFRPRMADGGTTLNNAQLPDPDFTFNTDYKYYVGRIDKICVSPSREFYSKTGIPSLITTIPLDESGGMNIYVLEIPPYTSSLNQISVKYIDNRRYTMADIGKLEKRIHNLEYYTQLSLLETQASSQSVTNSFNLDKFKNGFFVDSFTANDSLFDASNSNKWATSIWGWWNFRNSPQNTWNKGAARLYSVSPSDATNIDYKCAIDPLQGELLPSFETTFLTFDVGTLISTRLTGDLVTLDYTEKAYISQMFASKSVNVNPYNVIAFNGKIFLNPFNDMWVETNVLPTINRVIDIQAPDASEKFTNSARQSAIENGVTRGFKERSNDFWRSIGELKSVTETNLLSSTVTSQGNEVVDVQYIPFIRARELSGFAQGFQPNKRLYPFIDGSSLTVYSFPNKTFLVSNQFGDAFKNPEVISFRTGSTTGTIIGTGIIAYETPELPDGTGHRKLYVQSVLTGTVTGAQFITGQNSNSCTVISLVEYNYGDALVPDEYGFLSFHISLPGGIYPTGERTIRLIDDITNDTTNSYSIGETKYFTQGTLQSTQETLLTTRTVQNQKVSTFYIDPLAETFVIDSRVSPDGVYISSVDLFFRTKSSSIPVTVDIRKTINGSPESSITSIPFATCTLTPDMIDVSANSSVATRFTFDSLVYLLPGEYAITILSNSDDYEVFVSEMGKTDVQNSTVISKQPYAGVFFKSQNASTWTPVQEEDLKFRINIAEFAKEGTAEFTIDDIESINLTGTLTSGNAILTGVSSDSIAVGDYIYGTGIPAVTRILSIQKESATITLDKNVTATGVQSINVIPYFEFGTMHINTSNITPNSSSLSWQIKTLDAGTSAMSPFVKITTDVDTNATSMNALKPRVENAGVSSIVLQAVLVTEDTSLSPAIDTASISTIFVKSDINFPSLGAGDNEEVAIGGDALARYISKKVPLADGFDASNITVTLDAYRVSGTDIRVYYKTLAVESNERFEDQSWVRMQLQTDPGNSTNSNDFREMNFYPVGAFGSYSVPVDDPVSPRFNTWAIKIVLCSNNPAIVPMVKNLRAIALDS